MIPVFGMIDKMQKSSVDSTAYCFFFFAIITHCQWNFERFVTIFHSFIFFQRPQNNDKCNCIKNQYKNKRPISFKLAINGQGMDNAY